MQLAVEQLNPLGVTALTVPVAAPAKLSFTVSGSVAGTKLAVTVSGALIVT
jgi:hypothetical protein